MRYRLLGPLSVEYDDGELDLGGPRERVALAVLLLERNRVVSIDRLTDAIWDDSPPASAREQVHICISRLRRRFAGVGSPTVIETRRPGYLARVDPESVDLDAFAKLAAAGRSCVDAGRKRDALRHFGSALTLSRGAALCDIDSALVRALVVGVVEQQGAIGEDWLQAMLALGRYEEVCKHAADLVGRYPLRERLRHQQITALHLSGRTADALAAYRTARETFAHELGIEPSAQLRRLHRTVLAHGATADDVPEPLRIVPRQLPVDTSDFTGRADLVRRLRTEVLSSRGATRVVVITGPAGAGKTTLAVHVAHQVADRFVDGHLYVDMRGASHQPLGADEALEGFLRALGVSGRAVPEGSDERVALFRSLVAGRRLLVVIDDAVDEEHARRLLPGGPHTAVVITGRRRLTGLDGAVRVEVGDLSVDEATEMLSTLTDRSAGPAAAIAPIVRLCGGLPLALRIAAVRLTARPHWTWSDLADRLGDERNRLDELSYGGLGVRGSIAMSHDGLGDKARRLFRRLGLIETPNFPGWVAMPLLDGAGDAGDVLDDLADARLVEVWDAEGTARYRMHELVRVYARERLALDETSTDRLDALTRFLGCVLYLAEAAHRRVYGGDHTVLHSAARRTSLDEPTVRDLLRKPLVWLESERSLLVTAVEQAARGGLAEYAWDLAITSVTLFELGTYLDDWRRTHGTALAAARRAGDVRGEAAMRYSLGALAVVEHRLPAAVEQLCAAEAAFDAAEDGYGRALVLRHQAFVDRLSGRLDSARATYERARRLLALAGDPVADAHVLSGVAQIAIDEGRFDEAEATLLNALALTRNRGSQRLMAQLAHRLGELCLARDRLDEAADRFDSVLAVVRRTHDQVGEAYALLGLGLVAVRQGRPDDGERHLRAGLAVAERIGERFADGRLRAGLAEVFTATGRPIAAAVTLAHALASFRNAGSVVWQARVLDSLGQLHAEGGDVAGARSAWTAGLHLLEDPTVTADAELAQRFRTLLGGGPS